MSDYARQHDFSAKTGTTIFGSEVDDEFDALVTAVASKVDESREGAANGIATLGAGALIPAGISGTPASGGGQLPEATATALGAVELATAAEALALVDASRVITADTLDDVLTANAGILKDLYSMSSPGADRLIFWDNSAGGAAFLTVSTGLSLSGTSLSTNDAAIVHDNLSGVAANDHIDHSTVSITAGNGLTGGGTIAATRTLNVGAGTGIAVAADSVSFSPGALSSLTIESLALDDSVVVYDTSAAEPKLVPIQAGGTKVTAASTKTLNDQTDVNQIYANTGTSSFTITVAPESTFDFPLGSEVGFVCTSSGTITLAEGAGVTITSLGSAKTVKSSGGGAYLVKVGTNAWTLLGDLQ